MVTHRDDEDEKEVAVSDDVLDGILDEGTDDEDDPLMKEDAVEDDKGWE